MRVVGSKRRGSHGVAGEDVPRRPIVLHLDHTVEPGGAELALARTLAQADGWSPILRIPRVSGSTQNGGAFAGLVQDENVTVDFAGVPQKPGASNQRVGLSTAIRFAVGACAASIALRASSSFRRADVIHANTSRSAVYGALACLFSRKQLVVHLRDATSKASLGPAGYLLFSRLALKRANGVISNSHATLGTALPYLSRGTKQAVIASPIGFDRRDDVISPPRADVRRIGMVARLDPWKGHGLLLHAFAEACGGSNVRLVLAGGSAFGKDAYFDELKSLVRELGIEKQVDFLGHVDDVRGVIEQLDVCVQASVRPEPLGQNILQYLVLGKPIIAANAGGPAEWIEHGVNGLLFEMGSEASLREALREMVGNRALREKLGVGASITSGINTDYEVARQHYDFFRDLLSRKR